MLASSFSKLMKLRIPIQKNIRGFFNGNFNEVNAQYISLNGKNNIWLVKYTKYKSVIITSGHNVFNRHTGSLRDDIFGKFLLDLDWCIPDEYVINGSKLHDIASITFDDESTDEFILKPKSINDQFVRCKVLTMNNSDVSGYKNEISTPLLYSADMSLSLDSRITDIPEKKVYEIYNHGHKGVSGSAVFKNGYLIGMVSSLAVPLGENTKTVNRTIVYSWDWIKYLIPRSTSVAKFVRKHVHIVNDV